MRPEPHRDRAAVRRSRPSQSEVRIDAAETAEHSDSGALDEESTIFVRKILACVARTRGRYGKGVVAAVLRGSRARNVTDAGLDKLSTYGLLPDRTQDELLAWIDALVESDLLAVSRGAYPTLSLTRAGTDVMHGRAAPRVALRRRGLL